MATNKELLEHVVKKVDQMDTKLDQHGERLATMEERMKGHKEMHVALEKRDIWSAGTGIIAAVVAAFIGTQR